MSLRLLSHNPFPCDIDIAYISSDILIDPYIQSGAGGLGVVAGSISAELEHNYARHQTTAVIIGTYNSYGYQVQRLANGVMEPYYEREQHPEAVVDTGRRFVLMLAGRQCHVVIRTPANVSAGHALVLLLDTDVPENSEDFRMITRVLYGEGHATAFFDRDHRPWSDIPWMRVLQATVLGLGSFYAMREFGIACRIVHINDSHPVLYLVHQLGLYMRMGKTFDEALALVRMISRYTNHTVLESGNKRYPIDYIVQICGHYAGFDEETLRRISEDGRAFKMTTASLRLVGKGHANAVSKDHARIASSVFGYDFIPITNGVYVPEYQDPRFAELDAPEDIPHVKRIIKEECLIALCERAQRAGWSTQNMHLQDWLNAVLVVWARRCQSYKRSGLMWHHAELELVKKLLDWRYIAVAWGGLVHPDDVDMLRDWNKYLHRIRNLPNVMPIFNYRLDLMRPVLKSAAQVWLNTPQYGFEACGTSWMSAMLNCALPVSIADGGVLEAEQVVRFGSIELGDWHQQYNYDAESLWRALLPFVVKMRENDLATLRFVYEGKLEAEEKFSATRMVDDYREKLWK